MKLFELEKVARHAERAREVLAALDKTDGFEIDMLRADGHYAHRSSAVKVMDDAAFIEAVKAHLRATQTKTLNEALAQLAAHSIELDDPEANDGEEDELEDAA